MSYILDALKKAERERGLARVPTLGSIHEEAPKRGYGLWIAPMIALAAFGALLWALYPAPDEGDAPPRAGAPPEAHEPSPSAPGVTPPVAVTPPYPAALNSDPALVLPRAAPVPPAAAGNRPEAYPKPPPAAGGGPGAPPGSEPDAAAGRSEPNLSDAVAGMTLSVHMFSEQSADRLVFINGRRYVEGELVEKRYRIESITPEGAVLSFGGEREILRPGN